jgi:hypothetical protein
MIGEVCSASCSHDVFSGVIRVGDQISCSRARCVKAVGEEDTCINALNHAQSTCRNWTSTSPKPMPMEDQFSLNMLHK